MSTNSKKDFRFDHVLLDSMSEPLTVRVEKLRGSASTPIDLPPQGPDMASGVGWDRDGVRNLERWLVTEWSGGGLYHATVQDQTGKRMEWKFLYDPREFPERMPPTLAGIQPLPPSVPRVQVQPQQVVQPVANAVVWPQQQMPMAQPQPMPVNIAPGHAPTAVVPPAPAWTPTQWFQQQQTPQTQPQPQVQQQQQPWNGATRLQPRDDDFFYRRRRAVDDEEERERGKREALEQHTRELEARLQRQELERKEADYRAQLERQHQEAQRQLDLQRAEAEKQSAALREELRKLADISARPQVNPELERAKEERAQMERERERMEMERERERERVEAERREERRQVENDRRFAELQTLIMKIGEQPRNVGPDPAVVAMQEQQKALQEELRRERERAQMEARERDREERERREREMIKEDIRQRDEAAKRREDMLLAQMNELKSNANRGPDPLIQFMQENMRTHQETMREISRIQQDAANKLQASQMTPRDLIALMNDKSSGIDQLTKNVVSVYNDMFQTQRQMIEMAAQMTGGGGESTTTRLIEQGLHKASEAFDRYMRTKRDEVVSHAKVAEASAMAQAHAFSSQQQRLAAQARQEAMMQAQAAQTAQVAPSTPPQIPQGLNGAQLRSMPQTPQTSQPPAQSPQAPKAQTPQAPPQEKPKAQPIDDGLTDPKTGQTVAKVIPMRRLGKTDQEWFGMAHDKIVELRGAVKDYFDSISAKPPRLDKNGEIVGLDPEGVVDTLMQAVNVILAHQLAIPAVSVLFLEQRYADLMDVLLPDAPQKYRDDCVVLLAKAAKEDSGDPTISDEEEDEEEDDDAQEDESA